jgi:hypothetical protein
MALCNCGCGLEAETKNGWVRYHWNSTDSARKKNSDSLKGRIPWNKGLSADKDERLSNSGKKISKKLKGRISPNKNPDQVAQAAKVVTVKAMRSFLNRAFYRRDDLETRDDVLGYSSKELKDHLQSQFSQGMTWENHGRGGWHIDHIRQINTFPSNASPSEVNALSNLRPLWEEDNLKRLKK